jgi:preprotein translocase subunit SecG
MNVVLLVVHILLAVALIAVVLLQRVDGAGLGFGGGDGGGGFMTTRGTANLLTRTTAILAVCFMITSLTLVVLSGAGQRPKSIADDLSRQPVPTTPASPPVPSPPVSR